MFSYFNFSTLFTFVLLQILQQLQSEESGLRVTLQPKTELSVAIPLSCFEETLSQMSAISEFQNFEFKCFFDAVNDGLNALRPYGQTGMPMPWSSEPRVVFHSISDCEIVAQNIQEMLLDWNNFQVGCLPRRNFYSIDSSESQLSELRERNMRRLLNSEIIENEEQWLNYELEEAKTKIEVSDKVLDEIVSETILLLIRLSRGRNSISY